MKIEDWLMQYAIFWWYSETVGGGTQYTLSAKCRLVRGNPQLPGILDWFI
jgi:hypothetical protein